MTSIDAEQLQRLIDERIDERIQESIGTPAAPEPQGITLEDVLRSIDPRDSDSALMLLGWLQETGRLLKIGSLDGGGYIFHYSEPKGTTKPGYTPGATRGGRMVDEAVDRAKASGATPIKRGLCDKCFSAVRLSEDGTTVLDDAAGTTACPGGGTHNLMA